MVVKIIILATLYITLHVGLFKIFERARLKSWYALIPGVDIWAWLKMLEKPWWWIFLFFIPGVNIIMLAVLLYNTPECFGKDSQIDKWLAVLAFPVVIPQIGFDSKLRYLGPEQNKKEGWLDAIVFAVVAATVIRTFFFEAFQIPTPSMEKSLMVGDFLFVSKISYGARSPMTPLAIPFTHNTMPRTLFTKSYSEWITLPYFRLPGLGNVERGDVVVFNFPASDTTVAEKDAIAMDTYYYDKREKGFEYVKNKKLIVHPIDRRDHYVKRCVAVAGEEVKIINDSLYVNNQYQDFPTNAELNYYLGNFLSNTKAAKLGSTVSDLKNMSYYGLAIPFSSKAKYNEAFKITSVAKQPYGDKRMFPYDSTYGKWTIANFGPLKVPKKGETIELNKRNVTIYGQCINNYDMASLTEKGGKYFIDGVESKTYTFKQDHYFMMGDNRHGSLDSRYWGFVPMNHIVGKPVLVWFSIDPDKPFLQAIRWERLISVVGKDGISQSYLIHTLIVGLLLYGLNLLYKKGYLKLKKG